MKSRCLALIVFWVFSAWQPLWAYSDAQSRQLIFTAVNHYRVEQGLRPLQMLPALNALAEKHSDDMAAHRIPFGHAGFAERSKKVFQQFKTGRGIAENVAYRYEDAHLVVEQWLKSSPHRANILGHYNFTGIGIAKDPQGTVYVTQLFLRA